MTAAEVPAPQREVTFVFRDSQLFGAPQD